MPSMKQVAVGGAISMLMWGVGAQLPAAPMEEAIPINREEFLEGMQLGGEEVPSDAFMSANVPHHDHPLGEHSGHFVRDPNLQWTVLDYGDAQVDAFLESMLLEERPVVTPPSLVRTAIDFLTGTSSVPVIDPTNTEVTFRLVGGDGTEVNMSHEESHSPMNAARSFVAHNLDRLEKLTKKVSQENSESADGNNRRLSTGEPSIDTPFESIRVALHLTPGTVLSNSMKEALYAATMFIERAFRVQRVSGGGKMVFTPTCRSYIGGHCSTYSTLSCYYVPVPDQHLGPRTTCTDASLSSCTTTPAGDGISGDVVIYVTSEDLSCEGETLGWATTCLRDQNDRPVAGRMNVCSTSSWESSTMEYRANFFLHEIIHSLGLSGDNFSFYRNQDLTPVTQRLSSTGNPAVSNGSYVVSANTVAKVTSGSRSYSILRSPKIQELTRQYFGCPTALGVPLEDEGASGTVNSHFDKRVMEDEIMTGLIGDYSIVSAFSLGAFFDSGWYVPRFDWANELYTGRKEDLESESQRCNFVSLFSPCMSSGKSALGDTFCSKKDSTRQCLPNLLGSGYCEYNTYSTSIPSEFRYFGYSNVGGYQYYNYCPVRMLYTSSDSGKSSTCLRSEQPKQNYFLEKYGSASRCISGTLVDRGYKTNSEAGACYSIKCYVDAEASATASALQYAAVDIITSAGTVTCGVNEEGQQMHTLSNANGYLVCPEVKKVCAGYPCLNAGFWRENRCVCKPGYLGLYCENEDTVNGRKQQPPRLLYDYEEGTLQTGKYYELNVIDADVDTVDTLGTPGSQSMALNVSYYAAFTPLPEGLAVNSTTGRISGVPTSTSNIACKPYTITSVTSTGKESRYNVYLQVNTTTPAGATARSQYFSNRCQNLIPSVAAFAPTGWSVETEVGNVTAPALFAGATWIDVLAPVEANKTRKASGYSPLVASAAATTIPTGSTTVNIDNPSSSAVLPSTTVCISLLLATLTLLTV